MKNIQRKKISCFELKPIFSLYKFIREYIFLYAIWFYIQNNAKFILICFLSIMSQICVIDLICNPNFLGVFCSHLEHNWRTLQSRKLELLPFMCLLLSCYKKTPANEKALKVLIRKIFCGCWIQRKLCFSLGEIDVSRTPCFLYKSYYIVRSVLQALLLSDHDRLSIYLSIYLYL